MLLKKYKILIYMLLPLFVLNFILPIYSFAIDEDSVYVWSSTSSSISTSNNVMPETQINTQENTRKFFRNNFRWCCINGSKNWNYFI